MVPAQLPGNEVTAAVPEEEADGLQHSHQGEDNANGGGGTVALKHAYEKGITSMLMIQGRARWQISRPTGVSVIC